MNDATREIKGNRARLRKALKERAFTLTDVAALAGVSYQAAWNVVSGRARSEKIEDVLYRLTGVRL